MLVLIVGNTVGRAKTGAQETKHRFVDNIIINILLVYLKVQFSMTGINILKQNFIFTVIKRVKRN